jgi:hypothetical protein
MLAPIGGNPAEKDVVVAAFDDVDGIDLHVAEMLDRGECGLWGIPKRGLGVELLGAQPDLPCLNFLQEYWGARPWFLKDILRHLNLETENTSAFWERDPRMYRLRSLVPRV